MSKSKLNPLPESYTAGLPGCQQDAKVFFEAKVAQCDRNEVEAEFKRTLVLETQKSRRARVKKPRVSKKALTAREKRDLGLARLPKVSGASPPPCWLAFYQKEN